MSGQAAFMAALFDPEKPAPDGLRHPQGGNAAARLAVYRNNVVYGLMQNLRAGFPLLLELLGDARFDELAETFARAHPPSDPLIFAYGAVLPDFIDTFAPLAAQPYAGDVARLELAMRGAADAVAHQAIEAAAINPDILPDAVAILAPTLHVLASDWPLHELYLYLNGVLQSAPDMAEAQALMIYRMPTGGVALELLPPDGARFLLDIQAGMPLAHAAHGLAPEAMTDMLTRLLLAGLIADIK